MAGVYLLNPDRYMTPEMCEPKYVKFAWSSRYMRLNKIDPHVWLERMRCKYRETVFIRYEDEKDKINQAFSTGLWDHSPKRSWVYDPYTVTDGAHVLLPVGTHARIDDDTSWSFWTPKIGIKLAPDHPKFRVVFNTLSILYASRHPDLDVYVDPDGTLNTGLVLAINTIEKKGEKMSNREPGELALLLGSAQSKEILVGMRMIVMRNANRLEDAMDAEVDGEINKEVTALSQTVFSQAHAMAKLLDPSLRAAPKVQIGIRAGGQVSIDGSSDSGTELDIASALKELTNQGVPLKDITDQMLLDFMDARANGDTRAIAAVIENNTIDAASPF